MGKLNTANPEMFTFKSGDIHIDVLGGIRMSGLDRLRVTLRITSGNLFPLRNNIDLYQSDQVEKLVGKASSYFERDSHEVRTIFNELIAALEQFRFESLEHLYNSKNQEVELLGHERQKALAFLKQPDLMNITLDMIGKSGVVGEENNRLLLYLIFTSRLTSNPLHAVIHGKSGEGKTHLQETVASLIATEYLVELTSLTENALYYFDKDELNNKVITIEDMDGAEKALFPIRELQSKRQLTKTYTQRDSKGNMRTVSHVVEGKVVFSGCTNKESLFEDNSNRSISLHVDSSQEQDNRILKYHQDRYSGKNNSEEEQQIRILFQNCQRVLKPVPVLNPYASEIVLPDFILKPRRTMAIVLSLIETITLYHQYQRKVKKVNGVPHIVSTKQDVKWANLLLKDCLLQKSDYLSVGCRRYFETIKQYLNSNKTNQFYSRDINTVRHSTQKKYLRQLLHEGYIQIKSGNRHRGYLYVVTGSDKYQNIIEQWEKSTL